MLTSIVRSFTSLVLLLLAVLSLEAHAAPGVAVHLPLPNRIVKQFAEDVWFENIAVRSNGNLLLTTLTPNASLYEIQNPSSKSPTVVRHFTIDSVRCLFGVVETAPDVFAVSGGSFNDTTGGVKGSFALWAADFAKEKSPKPKLIAKIPDAILLNGATTVPNHRNLVLLADSSLNVVWRVDVNTGKVDVAVTLPQGVPYVPNTVSIVTNGLHARNDYLWWSNYTQTTNPKTGAPEAAMYRIKITDKGSTAAHAKAEKRFNLPITGMDDFTFGPGKKDLQWVATNTNNQIFAVNSKGKYALVAGATDSFTVATSTSCTFGRTKHDGNILYVATGYTTLNGVTRGGKVVAIDTTGFCL